MIFLDCDFFGVSVVTGEDVFAGDSPQVTWVHPTSSLLGWSPGSSMGLLLVGGMIIVVAAVVVIVVGCGDVNSWVIFQDAAHKRPPNQKFQHWGLLPLTTTIMV